MIAPALFTVALLVLVALFAWRVWHLPPAAVTEAQRERERAHMIAHATAQRYVTGYTFAHVHYASTVYDAALLGHLVRDSLYDYWFNSPRQGLGIWKRQHKPGPIPASPRRTDTAPAADTLKRRTERARWN